MKQLLIAVMLIITMSFNGIAQPVITLDWVKQIPTPQKFTPKQPFMSIDGKSVLITGVNAEIGSDEKFAIVQTDLDGNFIKMVTIPEIADFTVYQSLDKQYIYGHDAKGEGYLIYVNTENLEIESSLQKRGKDSISLEKATLDLNSKKLIQTGTYNSNWIDVYDLETREVYRKFDRKYFENYTPSYKKPFGVQMAYTAMNGLYYILITDYQDDNTFKHYLSLDIIDSNGTLVYRDANFNSWNYEFGLAFNNDRSKMMYATVKSWDSRLKFVDLNSMKCYDTIAFIKKSYNSTNFNNNNECIINGFGSMYFNWDNPKSTHKYYDIDSYYMNINSTNNSLYSIKDNQLHKYNLYPTSVSESKENNVKINYENELLTLSFELPESIGEQSELEVTNEVGESFYKERISILGGQFQLPLSHLPKGAYFVRLKMNNQIYLNKFIK